MCHLTFHDMTAMSLMLVILEQPRENIAYNEQHILMGGDQVIERVPLNNTTSIKF